MQVIQKVKSSRYIKGLRRPSIGTVFVVGLMLGWVVLGWWLWPVEWSDADPWDLRPEHQAKYVSLVAEEYWQTGDLYQATTALAGWEIEALANLMAAMQCQTCGSQESQQFAALLAALRLPPSLAFSSSGSTFASSSSPSSSSSRSSFKAPDQPIIWGAILSLPMPVVAVSIIVSLRFLKFGTARVRKKRRRTRPEELEQEWVTTTEEQLAEERQPRARQPGAQQAQPQQAEAQQAQPQQAAAQAAQMQQQMEAQAAQMKQQSEKAKEALAAQTQQTAAAQTVQAAAQTVQMQEQMEQQMQAQMDMQIEQMRQQMQEQMEEAMKLAQVKPETTKQAREQTSGMLSPMTDWLGGVREQLQGMKEQAPEMQQLLSPMLDQVDFLMTNMGQMQKDIPTMNQQQLQGKMGQMQMQMVKMLEQFRGLEGNLPADAPPEARAALAQMQQFAMQMMAQFQQQAGQVRELQGTFDDTPMEAQKSDLEASLADIMAEAFDEEEAMDPHLEALIKSLPYVDIQDVVEKAKEVVDQLKRGVSLAPGLIYEVRGGTP